MRCYPLFALLFTIGPVVAPPLQAVDVVATGISAPFFDPNGKLTHRLLAKQGVKDGNLRHLREVEIHYFSAADPNVVVQKLETTEATWDENKETLTGPGKIVVATEENRLTGVGFDFALGTSVLHIHREFEMNNREVVVTSDRATVELLLDKAGGNVKVRDVKRCEAIGNLQILIQPTATKDYGFEKAFSEIAIYDGQAQTITMPKPTRTLRKGAEARSDRTVIKLKNADPAAK